MQTYTSRNTSVNTANLPAIYNKINWEEIIKDYRNCQIHVWDMGCGRKTSHIVNFLSQFGIYYHGYDPYWINGHNEKYFDKLFKHVYDFYHLNIFICSNVLNVIHPWERMLSFKYWFTRKSDMYFISVYTGDKTGNGKVSKEDCWQWNKPLKDYITSDKKLEVIRKGVLAPHFCASYIK